jgi:glycosyltransferase involved in cell wall biosynthesis
MKGHRHLIDALPRVAERHPEIRLLIVGDGELRADLEAQADRLGVRDRIVFAGTRLDLRRILNSIDVAVLASVDKEGLPMILVESALMRRPLVMTDVAGIREMVTDGETGWLVRPEDSTALADALCAALDDPAEAAKRATAAEVRVRAAFDVRATTRQMDEVYNSVRQMK